MSTLTVETPSGALRVRKSSCIGHFFVIGVGNERFLANCIDATPDDAPKRMRIQTFGSRKGDVVMPGDYIIFEKDPDWED